MLRSETRPVEVSVWTRALFLWGVYLQSGVAGLNANSEEGTKLVFKAPNRLVLPPALSEGSRAPPSHRLFLPAVPAAVALVAHDVEQLSTCLLPSPVLATALHTAFQNAYTRASSHRRRGQRWVSW